MPRPPKPAGTVASGEEGTSPETGGCPAPAQEEATGDNIRKDGTDADNADGKSAQPIPLHSPTEAAERRPLRALGDPAGL